MAITTEISGTVAKILLSGGIDYAKLEEFKSANKQALSASGVKEIQVDFAGTTFLDSSAIRSLLVLKKETEASGKSLLLLNCNETLRDIFEIGGFDRVFTFG
jgi:anti-sigma B factor antagonist